MLVLTREINQSILIGDLNCDGAAIEITVTASSAHIGEAEKGPPSQKNPRNSRW